MHSLLPTLASPASTASAPPRAGRVEDRREAPDGRSFEDALASARPARKPEEKPEIRPEESVRAGSADAPGTGRTADTAPGKGAEGRTPTAEDAPGAGRTADTAPGKGAEGRTPTAEDAPAAGSDRAATIAGESRGGGAQPAVHSAQPTPFVAQNLPGPGAASSTAPPATANVSPAVTTAGAIPDTSTNDAPPASDRPVGRPTGAPSVTRSIPATKTDPGPVAPDTPPSARSSPIDVRGASASPAPSTDVAPRTDVPARVETGAARSATILAADGATRPSADAAARPAGGRRGTGPVGPAAARPSTAPGEHTAGTSGSRSQTSGPTPLERLTGAAAAGAGDGIASGRSGNGANAGGGRLPMPMGGPDRAAPATSPAVARAAAVDARVQLENLAAELSTPDGGSRGVSLNAPVLSGAGESVRGAGETSAGPGQTGPGADETAQTGRLVRGISAMVNQRGGVMNMRLQPPELGELRVQMSIVQGTVTARFAVGTEQAQALLHRNLAALRTALEGHGLTVERLTVHLAPTDSSSAFRHESGDKASGEDGRHDAAGHESRGRQEREGSAGRHGRDAPADFTSLFEGAARDVARAGSAYEVTSDGGHRS